MTDQVFCLPDLGEGLTEATILEWRVQAGDTVSIDQIVVEVETAKASVEVPIPFAGTVTRIHGEPGDIREVGTPLISVDGGDTEADSTDEQAGSGNVLVGYGTSPSPARRRRRTAAIVVDSVGSASEPQAPTDEGARVISPIVRTLARSHHVDLTELAATAAGQIITRSDVENALRDRQSTERAAVKDASDKTYAIAGFRKAVTDKLCTSRREIPDATTWVDVDATEVLAARRAINAVLEDNENTSLLALLARLAVAALAVYPELNSTVNSERNEITQHVNVHLGIATQTARGLLVPVIKNADTMSTVALAHAVKETTTLARDGRLGHDRLSGGTFTFNNYGVFGVDGSTPIINHPEAAILGIGRIVDRPWIVGGQIAIRKVTQVSLAFDHRVCDGATAGGFLRLFADFLENPVAALGRI